MPQELNSRLPRPMSKAEFRKSAAVASFTDSFISVHFGVKGDVSLVLKLSSVLLVFFFKLLSLIAMCLKQRKNISVNLWSQLDWKSVGPNLIFCFV